MSDTSQGPGWWLASDGKWFSPELHPDAQLPPPAPEESPEESEDAGVGQFGDGIAKPLYEFRASLLRGGRMFTPNIIRVWPDRVEEYEHHASGRCGAVSKCRIPASGET